jgi:hypothetical protein
MHIPAPKPTPPAADVASWWTIINNKIGPAQISDTYHITKATEAIGFGCHGWGFLLDNNLLLTWLAKIRIIWLRCWGIYDRWSTITIRHKRGFRRRPTRRGIGRRAARGRHLLNVIGREEPLLPMVLASPPICIRFSNYLDDIAFAEGQIIRFLRHRQG